MASEHPFQLLFETLGRVPAAHAESVNRKAHEILADILSVPVEKTGRCILLRAPRAGHGKTHLLSRIQHQLGADHEFIPLQAAFGCRIDSATVTSDALRRLVRQLPASGGLTILDLVTRRLFASALQPLVGSGEVPCQDREGALTALRARPIETFDFHHPNAVTAHWARENFDVLGQRLSQELAQRAGLPIREVAFWVDVLFRFASAPLENSNRVRILAENVQGGAGAEIERLEALLGLLTMLTRVVLVADDLEGFSADETAALRLASFLGSLRQSVERLDVILSVNKDIWESAFVPRLSGGLADRLSEVVVELEPLTEGEMAELLDSRVPGLGQRVLEKVDMGSAGTHARGLIQAAGMAWLKATATDSSAPAPAASAVATAPVPEEPLPVVSNEEPTQEEPVREELISPAVEVPQQVQQDAEPAVVSPAPVPVFKFSPNPVEAIAGWPSPEFAPASPPPLQAEPPVFLDPVESAFSPEPVPAVTGEARQWDPPSPDPDPILEDEQSTATVWNPPAPAPEVLAEPQFQSFATNSPFQAAAEPRFDPEPTVEQQSSSGTWQPEAQPLQDPTHVDSPFQPAAQQFAPARLVNPEQFQAAEFAPSYPAAPPQVFTPEPQSHSAPVYQPAQIVQNDQPSPFSAAQDYAPPVESGFQATPQPVYPAQQQPQEATPPPSVPDTDRVDDLLKQFRERYGRGSL